MACSKFSRRSLYPEAVLPSLIETLIHLSRSCRSSGLVIFIMCDMAEMAMRPDKLLPMVLPIVLTAMMCLLQYGGMYAGSDGVVST